MAYIGIYQDESLPPGLGQYERELSDDELLVELGGVWGAIKKGAGVVKKGVKKTTAAIEKGTKAAYHATAGKVARAILPDDWVRAVEGVAAFGGDVLQKCTDTYLTMPLSLAENPKATLDIAIGAALTATAAALVATGVGAGAAPFIAAAAYPFYVKGAAGLATTNLKNAGLPAKYADPIGKVLPAAYTAISSGDIDEGIALLTEANISPEKAVELVNKHADDLVAMADQLPGQLKKVKLTPEKIYELRTNFADAAREKGIRYSKQEMKGYIEEAKRKMEDPVGTAQALRQQADDLRKKAGTIKTEHKTKGFAGMFSDMQKRMNETVADIKKTAVKKERFKKMKRTVEAVTVAPGPSIPVVPILIGAAVLGYLMMRKK